MCRITLIAGARPNFMKIAPILHAIEAAKEQGRTIEYRLVHTGQHYDHNMSESFFEQLQIPEPHVNLECHGGTQAEQTAAILVAFEKDLQEHPAEVVLVVGDVTSTMACALVAQKLHTKVAHVEAGIRSGDWTMPEEINRLVTDSITNYFFTTSELANANLLKSGVDPNAIFYVGNTMIDTLLKHKPYFKTPAFWEDKGLEPQNYLVLTLHRPANVDQEAQLKAMLDALLAHSRNLPIIFPVHPRTAKILEGLDIKHPQLHLVPPLSYLEFNYLVQHAKAVVTDSGGITEEASVMGVPCMTLRDTTERPETITLGTNELVGTNPKHLKPFMDILFKGDWKEGRPIPMWDGKTAKRIVDILLELQSRQDLGNL